MMNYTKMKKKKMKRRHLSLEEPKLKIPNDGVAFMTD